MQPDPITLAVTLANDLTVTNQVFSLQERQVNRTTYNGPGHSPLTRHTLQLYRTYAKRTGIYLGSTKTTVKFTKDVGVSQADSTETKAPLIVEVNFSVPVGASDAEVLAVRQQVIALLDRDDIMVSLNSNATI